MEALILNGDTKSALAAVRSLGRRGIRITCGAEKQNAMALHSKYVTRRFVYRSPLTNPEGFLKDILAECTGAEPPVLFVFSDAAYLTFARNRVVWEGKLLMPLPTPENVERAFHKGATIALAESLDIPVPYTRGLKNMEDSRAAWIDCASIPVVVKPAHSASWKGQEGVFGSVRYAFSEMELRRIVRELYSRFGEYPIVERYIRGSEFGFECLCRNGEVLVYSAHRRIRSLNPTGGAAVVKETIEPDALMKANAEKLLQALSWEGPAMVEFKHDEMGGGYRLIEVNGRFWGSLPLAIFAGTDFPSLYFELAKGNALPEGTPYIRGVRSRHYLGDVHHLLKVLFASDPMRKIAYPSRLSALGDFFKRDNSRSDVYDASDTRPSVMEYVSHL